MFSFGNFPGIPSLVKHPLFQTCLVSPGPYDCVTLTTSCCGGEILTQPGVPGRGSVCTETEADNFQKPYCRVQYPPVKYFKTGFEKKARTLVSFGLYHCGEAYSQSIFMQK